MVGLKFPIKTNFSLQVNQKWTHSYSSDILMQFKRENIIKILKISYPFIFSVVWTMKAT